MILFSRDAPPTNMHKAAAYTWITCLWLIFVTGVLCDGKIVKRQSETRPSSNSCLEDEEFKCKSGECIDGTLICDGPRDCRDGSDETLSLCKSVSCQSFMFKCKYGACIKKSEKCDGIKNCADGSDEVSGCPGSVTVQNIPSITTTTTRRTLTRPQITVTEANHRKCVIPSNAGYLYSLQTDPNTVLPHGSKIDAPMVVEVNCGMGYYKNSQVVITVTCLPSGTWSSTYSDLCLRRCPPIVSDSLELTCTYNGESVDCSKPAVFGTKLKPKCKSTHQLLNGARETPIELKCDVNGSWNDSQLYSCHPKCGKVYKPNTPLITKGRPAKYGSAPWNVGIYRINNTNQYEMICGGTLISANLVVSAAHCFWNEETKERIITNLNGDYKIAVGKYSREYYGPKDNQYTDFFDLKTIYMHDTFIGFSGSYDEDITVIELQSKVTMSPLVAPICMYWNPSDLYNIADGSIGQVVGWGDTERNESSPILLETKLPFISRKKCQTMFPDSFQRYITYDKFCAGAVKGLGGVQSGDSGAGLTFEHDNTHYLLGVVSSKDSSSNNSIGIFTNVIVHINWIENYYVNNKAKRSINV